MGVREVVVWMFASGSTRTTTWSAGTARFIGIAAASRKPDNGHQKHAYWDLTHKGKGNRRHDRRGLYGSVQHGD